MRKRKKNIGKAPWKTIFLFPLCIVFYEILFRLVTVKDLTLVGTPYMILFSLAYGCVGYLISTAFKKNKVNGIVTSVLLFLLPICYLIEYFVYRQFKIFYDLNTVFGGAADAVGGYSHEIWRMLFSPIGLITVFLYLLPGILYLVFLKKSFPQTVSDAKKRIIALVAGIVLFLGCFVGIKCSTRCDLIYGKEYSYQAAVSNFGLVTGVRLDIREALFGTSEEFEPVVEMPIVAPVTQAVTESDDTSEVGESDETEAPVEEIVYTPNVMNIDFASKPASGTIAELNAYVSSLTPTMKNQYTGMFEGKNLIFITAEAFTAEAIDPELTPTLYRMATKGIQFTDFYQQNGAGTTGGEYQNIFGMLPMRGGMSFKNTADHLNYFTMGNQLNRLGYFGMAFHNNDYTYYDRHRTHINLGYSEGFMGYGNGIEEYVTPQWPQSDLEMIQGTLPLYMEHQPFNVYYMSVSGHSGYTYNSNSMSRRNWEKVEDLPYSEPVMGYLAAQIELENSMAYLLEQLEAAGIEDDTVICISADHFPYGLDDDAALGNMPYLSELFGYNVDDAFERDHNRLILWCGMLEDDDPIVIDTPTSSLDILPTLSNLFGTEFDSRLMPGRDVFSEASALVFDLGYNWKTEYGTYLSGTFTPADDSIELPDGYVAAVSAVVRNKLQYCRGVLDTDYFRYLFG